MSMKERQISRVMKKATEKELKSGRLPSSFVMSRYLLEEFKRHAAGTPSFRHKDVEDHSVSNPKLYNESLHLIREDLESAFEELVDQGRRLQSSENLRETERKAMERMMRETERLLDGLEDRLENPFALGIISEDFHTFNAVEFKGDPIIGRPDTDSEIDLEAGAVTLPVISSRALRHDLSGADVRITPDASLAVQEEQPFTEALRDHVNGSWRYLATREGEGEAAVTVVITLPESVDATKLQIDARTIEGMLVEPAVSSNGTEWKTLLPRTVNGRERWQFGQMDVQAVRLTLNKPVPDKMSGTTGEYLFQIQNLSLVREHHKPEARLVTRPFDVDGEVVDEILLQTKETTGPETSIRYYVGFEDENFVEWQEISPDVPMKLNQLDRTIEYFEAGTPQYGASAGTFFGVDHHVSGLTAEEPAGQNLTLYAGDYMWQVETKPIPEVHPYELPSLADWVTLKASDTAYLPVEQTVSGEKWKLTAGTLQRFSIDVLMDRDEEVYNVHLEIGEGKAQVYLNNEPLRPGGDNRYTYRMKKGWNRIQIVTHAEKEEPFAPNLYFRDIAKEVLANREPLKQVQPWHLQANVPKKDIRHFALDGRTVTVNYDPKQYDVTGEGIRYRADYRYVPEGAVPPEQLRLMAVLENTGDGSVTPILRKYKLIVK